MVKHIIKTLENKNGYYFELESLKRFKNNCEYTQFAIVLGNILIIKVICLRLI